MRMAGLISGGRRVYPVTLRSKRAECSLAVYLSLARTRGADRQLVLLAEHLALVGQFSLSHGLADLVQHRLLAFADLLGTEPHEAALLGRLR